MIHLFDYFRENLKNSTDIMNVIMDENQQSFEAVDVSEIGQNEPASASQISQNEATSASQGSEPSSPPLQRSQRCLRCEAPV